MQRSFAPRNSPDYSLLRLVGGQRPSPGAKHDLSPPGREAAIPQFRRRMAIGAHGLPPLRLFLREEPESEPLFLLTDCEELFLFSYLEGSAATVVTRISCAAARRGEQRHSRITIDRGTRPICGVWTGDCFWVLFGEALARYSPSFELLGKTALPCAGKNLCYTADRVFVCGEREVIAVDEGQFAGSPAIRIGASGNLDVTKAAVSEKLAVSGGKSNAKALVLGDLLLIANGKKIFRRNLRTGVDLSPVRFGGEIRDIAILDFGAVAVRLDGAVEIRIFGEAGLSCPDVPGSGAIVATDRAICVLGEDVFTSLVAPVPLGQISRKTALSGKGPHSLCYDGCDLWMLAAGSRELYLCLQ